MTEYYFVIAETEYHQMRTELAELRAQRASVAAFIAEVNRRAEATIETTHVVAGAHWNAMRQVAAEWGIEVRA